MGDDRNAAIEVASEAVHRFPDRFRAEWLSVFAKKIGLATPDKDDAALIQTLLGRMETLRADFTNTFRALGTPDAKDEFVDPEGYLAWERDWRDRLSRDGTTPEARRAAMACANPALIPRNHRIEQAIAAAVGGDFAPFERLTEALRRPYDDDPASADLRRPPTEDEAVRQTFCGT
jgi:uncharacterized protein YdiU (UPF0061 family)